MTWPAMALAKAAATFGLVAVTLMVRTSVVGGARPP
jgi:hypothetical protein